jgi:type 1 glutamine amidotransferase
MQKLRVLLVTGGQGYDKAAFRAMWQSISALTIYEQHYPEAEQEYQPEHIQHYDALVFFDFKQTMSAAAQKNLQAAIAGGKGALFLHHAFHNYEDWPEYANIVGGAYIQEPTQIDGKSYGPFIYGHDKQIPVHIADPNHPITQGMSDFTLIDEFYGNTYISPTVTPLLTTTYPESMPIIGWAHSYGQGRVVYLQPGDTPSTYENPHYRQLIRRTLRWIKNSNTP